MLVERRVWAARRVNPTGDEGPTATAARVQPPASHSPYIEGLAPAMSSRHLLPRATQFGCFATSVAGDAGRREDVGGIGDQRGPMAMAAAPGLAAADGSRDGVALRGCASPPSPGGSRHCIDGGRSGAGHAVAQSARGSGRAGVSMEAWTGGSQVARTTHAPRTAAVAGVRTVCAGEARGDRRGRRLLGAGHPPRPGSSASGSRLGDHSAPAGESFHRGSRSWHPVSPLDSGCGGGAWLWPGMCSSGPR